MTGNLWTFRRSINSAISVMDASSPMVATFLRITSLTGLLLASLAASSRVPDVAAVPSMEYRSSAKAINLRCRSKSAWVFGLHLAAPYLSLEDAADWPTYMKT